MEYRRDGATDEGVLSTFYADNDSDNYGSPTVSQEACTAPAAYVSDNTDCDDTSATTNPGGTETCNGTDDNCDGATDELGYHAVQDRVHVNDLHATMLHLLGMDHERLTYRYRGRDFRLTDVGGEIVRPILA